MSTDEFSGLFFPSYVLRPCKKPLLCPPCFPSIPTFSCLMPLARAIPSISPLTTPPCPFPPVTKNLSVPRSPLACTPLSPTSFSVSSFFSPSCTPYSPRRIFRTHPSYFFPPLIFSFPTFSLIHNPTSASNRARRPVHSLPNLVFFSLPT